jgi:hypothetical protein
MQPSTPIFAAHSGRRSKTILTEHTFTGLIVELYSQQRCIMDQQHSLLYARLCESRQATRQQQPYEAHIHAAVRQAITTAANKILLIIVKRISRCHCSSGCPHDTEQVPVSRHCYANIATLLLVKPSSWHRERIYLSTLSRVRLHTAVRQAGTLTAKEEATL